MAMRTIVIGVDGSSHSHKALEAAVSIAKAEKARLIIAGVLPFPEDLLDRALHWRTQAGFSRALEAAGDYAKKHKVKATPMLFQGKPSEELSWIARKSKADLIVVGSWGKSLKARAARVLVGSVARELFERASCSVLVVR